MLRDVSERVVIASKGRFDRAVSATERQHLGLPSEATIFRDEFMEATLDVWEMAPESARRVNHPAPFPAGLPQRLIDLYTYRGDIVLDPFMGSGTTAVAALRTDRHFLGYDTDPDYVAAAQERVEAEHQRLEREAGSPRAAFEAAVGDRGGRRRRAHIPTPGRHGGSACPRDGQVGARGLRFRDHRRARETRGRA